MILGMGQARKRRTLTGQISTIVLVLILVGLMEAGAAYTMLEWYHEQVAELEYTISDIYLSQTDQNFNLINTSIRSMHYDGREVRAVVESHYSLVDYATEIERVAGSIFSSSIRKNSCWWNTEAGNMRDALHLYR